MHTRKDNSHIALPKKKKTDWKTQWALVGLGRQAERIANAILRSDTAQLSAVASANPKRASIFAKRYSVPFFGTFEDVLKNPQVDSIFICSPNHEHARQSILASRAHKHFICEKPLALSSTDGRHIAAAAKKNNCFVGVGFHLRHHPLFQKAKALIKAGELGKLRLIEMHWSQNYDDAKLPPLLPHMRWREDLKRSGGGALMARGIHLYDLLQFISGAEIKEICARTDRSQKEGVDRTAAALVSIGQALATVVASRVIDGTNSISVYGSRGKMTLRDALNTDGTGIIELSIPLPHSIVFRKKRDVYAEEIDDFSKRILSGEGIGATGEDGLSSIALTEAFKKSVATGKTVTIAR